MSDVHFDSKHILRAISSGLSAYTENVRANFQNGNFELRYSFERSGQLIEGGIRLKSVVAFKFQTESACTAWHVKDAYDALVEVAPSQWLTEITEAAPQSPLLNRELYH